MGTQKNRLTETILLSTHNIGLEGQKRVLEYAKCPLYRALVTSYNTNYYTPTYLLVQLLSCTNTTQQGILCGRVVSVGDFETVCPGFAPQSRDYGHGGVSLGKAHFLA